MTSVTFNENEIPKEGSWTTSQIIPKGELPKMSVERRAQIFKVLRKSIKQIAKEKRQLTEKNAEFAKLCVLDAFQGRLSNGLANNSKKAKWIYQIFCIQTSDFMFKSVVIATTLHTFSIFFEPANVCPNSILFKLFQWIVMLIYATDIALKMGYEGVHEYFRHDWQQLYVANLIFGVLDLLICGCTNYSNPLRPLAGVLRARRGRKFFEILKKMIPGMIQNLIPVLFFVVIVMILCSIFFDTHVLEFKSTAYTFYNWLFLVLTNDTFDRLLPENLFFNLTYLMFFFPAIYVGQRFLFNLIIGDTYDTFRSYVKKQLKKEKLKELQGLTKAFSVLDIEKRGKISDTQWNALISKLYPELSEEALALYFELISGGNPNITILQFLSLRSVLSFNLSYSKDSTNIILSFIRNIYNKVIEYYQQYQINVTEKTSAVAVKVLEKCEEYSVWERLNSIDLIILSLELSDYPLIKVKEITLLTVCQFLLGIHCIEFILKLLQEKGKISQVSNSNNTISTLYVVGCIGCIVYYIITSFFSFYFTNDLVLNHILFTFPITEFAITYYKILMFFRLLRGLRIANYSEELRDFNAALLDILPTLTETFIFTFIVSYMFGTLGNIIFGNTLDAWKTPLLSIVKAQQLTFMVSFLSSMEEAMTSVHPAIAVSYFVTFLISSLTVSNIALSIIIDLHSNVLDMKSKKERDGNKKKLDLLFTKIIDQARLRRVMRSATSGAQSSKPPLNFKNIKLSSFQSSDVRHFIAQDDKGGGSNQYGFNLDELSSCQKYSNIDLMKFYNESHRNHKDMNWEISIIKSLHDLGIHEEKTFNKGDVIYEINDRARVLILLNKGAVVLSRPQQPQPQQDNSTVALISSTEECVAFSTKFIGSEALQPNGLYSMNCIAHEDGTKCFFFKQDDIAHNIDTDLLGAIIQMVFISNREIQHDFKLRKLRRQSSRMNSIRISPITTEDDSSSTTPKVDDTPISEAVSNKVEEDSAVVRNEAKEEKAKEEKQKIEENVEKKNNTQVEKTNEEA